MAAALRAVQGRAPPDAASRHRARRRRLRRLRASSDRDRRDARRRALGISRTPHLGDLRAALGDVVPPRVPGGLRAGAGQGRSRDPAGGVPLDAARDRAAVGRAARRRSARRGTSMPATSRARTTSSTTVAREARDGDLVVVMSNGGFDDIHQKAADGARGAQRPIACRRSGFCRQATRRCVVELPERIDAELNAWCVALGRALTVELRRCRARRRRRLLLGDRLLRSARPSTPSGSRTRCCARAAASRPSIRRRRRDHRGAGVLRRGVRSRPRGRRRIRGLRRAEVVELHARRDYRVYMVGFVPGFAYMARSTRASPRRAEPPRDHGAGRLGGDRRRADRHLSDATPGGWNIIGRTPVKPFDPRAHRAVSLQARRSRALPIRLERFELLPCRDAVTHSRPAGHADDGPGSRPLGPRRRRAGRRARWTRTRIGLPTSWSATRRRPPALEITLIGPELEARGDVTCAVAGADFELIAGDRDVPMHTRRLRCAPASGCASARGRGRARDARGARRVRRAAVFGSRATSLVSRMGRSAARAPPATCCRWQRCRRRTAVDCRAIPLPLPAAAPGCASSPVRRTSGSRPRPTARCSAPATRSRRSRTGWAIVSTGRVSRTRSRRRHSVGRDADRRASGAGVGPADPADGGSPDDGRLSEDRRRDHRRSAARRPAGARRLDRVRCRARATRRSTRSSSVSAVSEAIR